MTTKRFTVHIDWFNYEKTEGVAELKDNGQPLLISESVDDVRYIKDLLNEQHEEIVELKKDNLEAFGLLGTVRAYIRTGDTEEAIRKINTFEKEQLQ